MSARPNIKSAAGQCSLRVVETETRDAIVTDTPGADGKPHNSRTIAYVAIGAESWGPLLAAAPELAAVLREVADFWAGGDAPAELTARINAALAKACI
jgi:hypothetical protein